MTRAAWAVALGATIAYTLAFTLLGCGRVASYLFAAVVVATWALLLIRHERGHHDRTS